MLWGITQQQPGAAKSLSSTPEVSVGLVARSGLLPQHSSGARALAVRVLQEKNIVPRMDLER